MSDLLNNNHKTESKCDLDQPQAGQDDNNGVNTAFESWLIEYRERLAGFLEEDSKYTASDREPRLDESST